MTIDIDALETLAKVAGGDEWTQTYATSTNLARVWLPDGDAVCQCFGNIGHQPEAIDADDVSEYIAAANPAAILAIIAEVRALREDKARYRYLRERRFYYADNPNTSMYHKAGVDSGYLHVKTIDREGLDAAIDVARKEKA
jgi:hypothetical protein